MIFTEALKKEVFGSTTKNSTLANARIVERTTLEKQRYESPSFLKAATEIASLHEKQKTNS